MSKSRRVFLLGCGRVGTALAAALRRSGYEIAGVSDIDPRAARRAARMLRLKDRGAVCAGKARSERVRVSDIVVISTPDDRIRAVFRQIAGWLRPGQVVVHLSGALGSEILRPRRGCGRLALHPMMSFAELDPENARRIRGCGFVLEGDPPGIRLGKQIVRALDGRAFVMKAGDKPLFHAACVFASNFLDVVLDGAIELARQTGIGEQEALCLFEPLVLGTLRNVRKLGPIQALSGPAERGDSRTIRRHLDLLRKARPELVLPYRVLTARARQMARQKQDRRGGRP